LSIASCTLPHFGGNEEHDATRICTGDTSARYLKLREFPLDFGTEVSGTMKVFTLICGLAASGLASPAPQWQHKRAAAPAYAAHTIDQPVCVNILIKYIHEY
jgi:hypothetical protein